MGLQAVLPALDARGKEVAAFLWPLWARPNQLPPPGDWRTWLLLAGRGFGKTRTGAEWVRSEVQRGGARRLALVAPTAADVRDVMVEGESGILATAPPWFRPKYEPSKRRLTWPNGAQATTFSADEPDRFRGPQYDRAWCDEAAAWRYPEAFDQITLGLRLRDARGGPPRCLVTTTPRPTPLIRRLVADPTTHVNRGSTFDNRDHLAAAYLDQIVRRYEGTRLGRQELYAEVLDDTPGALWKRDAIDALRVRHAPDLARVVVAIDPAVTSRQGSDETGIVVAGLGTDGHGYVLADRSLVATPDAWARAAVSAYNEHRADRLIAEVNNGGDLVETVLRTVSHGVAYRAVHASRGKQTRAEPIAALYEQGRVHHVGSLPQLEDQLCSWAPATDAHSPDRLDALVWALSELMLGGASPVEPPATTDDDDRWGDADARGF
jgi:predicted phage terminase large subunit-like protein